MGLGHVYRSLALAEMLSEHFDCYFYSRALSKTLFTEIQKVCTKVVSLNYVDDQSELDTLSALISADDIVVLDGYHFKTAYQQTIKSIGCKLVCIDDIYSCHYVADAIINHAGGVSSADYSHEPYTQFCLGPAYSLVRPVFNNTRSVESRDGLFICLGGADPNNDTLDIVQKCISYDISKKIYLVLGGAYLHKEALLSFIDSCKLDIEILSSLSSQEMAHYMSICDTAITPPSTISYEYLTIGGTLYLKVIADNQIHIRDYFIENEFAFDMEEYGSIDKERIKSSLNNQSKIFDGKSKKRMISLFNALRLKSIKARIQDVDFLFSLVNDEEARVQSYSNNKVEYNDHVEWVKSKLDSNKTNLYISKFENNPIGQVRFDRTEDKIVLSYSISKKYRGQGLGSSIIRSGVLQFRKETIYDGDILAFVKSTNIPSIKVFQSLGLVSQHTDKYENSRVFILK